MTSPKALSSTSRLGRASQVITLGTSLVGLGFGVAAALEEDWTLLLPAGIFTVMSLVSWFTRVRTSVDAEQVTFAQLGKRIRVPVGEVHSCEARKDRFGLGAGLRWYGKKQWGMLSGDDYLEVLYGDGASLLVSHRSAEQLCEFLREGSS